MLKVNKFHHGRIGPRRKYFSYTKQTMPLTKQEILNIESQTGTRQIELRRDFNQATNLSAGGKRPLNAYMKAMLQAKENGDSSFMYKGVKYVRVETENNRMGGCFYMREGKKLSGGGLLEELESYASSDSQTASLVSDPSYVSSDASSSYYSTSDASYDSDKLEGGKASSDRGWGVDNEDGSPTKGEKVWKSSQCAKIENMADCKPPCRKYKADGKTLLKKCQAPDHGKNAKFAIVGHKRKSIKKGKRGAKTSHTVSIPVRKVSMKKSTQGKLRDVKMGYAKRTSVGGTTASKIVRRKGKYITKKKLKATENNKWLKAKKEATKAFKKLKPEDRDAFRFDYKGTQYKFEGKVRTKKDGSVVKKKDGSDLVLHWVKKA